MTNKPEENQTVEKEDISKGGIESGGPYDVVLRNITHYYGSNMVLKDISLAIKRKEFFGILGPSGSGKTTTMRIIGGFVIPTTGEVYLQNELMGRKPPYSRNTTMVFQHLALFPHMKVFDNLAYGLKVRRVQREEIKVRVKKVLEVVHLEGFGDRYPKQLSGGQQQRVALARALIVEPSVVLFDEPLGSLDLKLRREMQIEIKNIQRRLGTTFIYVTHDQQEALNMCDRIALLNEGRIEQIGTAEEIYERPNTRFVADFIGDINFIEGTVVSSDGKKLTIESDGLSLKAEAVSPLKKGKPTTICIRPERILMGGDTKKCDTILSGKIVNIVYSGAVRRCIVRLSNGGTVKVDLDAKDTADFRVDDETRIGWFTGDEVLLFNKA
ncbi:MAG: ABC transporter ATP-binding protein [Spirochaetes bacterium]|nr:ABC transporter ATP-binding protein [Spirochaetota bacterium]